MIYAGNRLLNANNSGGIIFVVIMVILFKGNADNGILFIMVPAIIFFTGVAAFYFEINQDELIIKNYMIPFLNIPYRLNEITDVQFLDTGFRSTATAKVKVIRGDKRSMSYQSASLRTADWQQFVDHLTEKKIAVKIEASTLKSKIGIPED